jgi:O-glycosyl hydrolase
LGQFSKFLLPDSVKVQATESAHIDKFQTIAFERPDNATVVIALNLSNDLIELNINDLNDGKISHVVQPNSIQTYIYYN